MCFSFWSFQGQATRFVKKFHEERRSKLAAVLDGERWRQVGDVPADVQAAVQRFLAADADAHGPATPTTAAEDPPTEVGCLLCGSGTLVWRDWFSFFHE